MSSSKKSVLITGCSAGGIGHAFAREFHSRGLHVFATARRLESMSELEALGITVLKLDVSDISSIESVRDEVASATGGKLDILVNNAGQAYALPVTDMDMSEVRSLFDVNFFGPISMVQKFVPLLISSGDARVVQVGSVCGIMPMPFTSAYNASKAALHAFGNTLRVELAPFNIKVINLITGGVKSNIARPIALPEDSLYKPIAHHHEKSIAIPQEGAVPTAEYAQQVVDEVLKPTPQAWFWIAKWSWLCWFVDTFLWRTFWDAMLKGRYGLSELSAIVKSGKAKSD